MLLFQACIPPKQLCDPGIAASASMSRQALEPACLNDALQPTHSLHNDTVRDNVTSFSMQASITDPPEVLAQYQNILVSTAPYLCVPHRLAYPDLQSYL